MRQLHYSYEDEQGLRTFVEGVKSELADNSDLQALFHVYVDTMQQGPAEQTLGILRDAMPGLAYVGASAAGNIIDGELVQPDGTAHVSVVCDLFEDPTTRFEVLQFPLDYGTQDSTADALVSAVAERPWVKAIEMHACVGDSHVPDFCEALSVVRPDIAFLGGAALCPETLDVTSCLPYVFSSEGELDVRGVVFTLYGGDNFHVKTQAVTGWKPLGRPFEVTRAEKATLYELDGRPAYDVYRQYLRIANDENFFQNGLLFPLSFDKNGMLMIKAPSKSNEDGSLVMTSSVSKEHDSCRIAYGDPATILNSVKESALVMRQFAPQAIMIYTCSARMLYWGADYVSRELRPFQPIAPTAGWFTGSEFARYGRDLLQYNVTLVVAGLREGEPRDTSDIEVQVDTTGFSRQMALVNSLTAFVGRTSAELQDAYEKMEEMAKTDGLTGVADRREIEALIASSIDEHLRARQVADDRLRRHMELAPCVIMFDLDDFKVVNDAYGHKAGDDVLKGLGALLREVVDDQGVGASGRWGGEEFMIVLPHAHLEEAESKAEEIRSRFADLRFPASGSHTLSLGVAQALPGESSDLLCSRVDKALYAAKKRGKNCVVVA